MRHTRSTLAALLAAATMAAGASGASAPGQLSVSVSPPTVTLPGGQATTLSVRNTGAAAAWINVSTGNFDITQTGIVRVDPKLTPGRSAKAWLKVSPTRLRLAAGATANVIVAAKPSKVAAPGDHQALVLFTTAGPTGQAVSIRARVGVTVLVRVSGPLRRALGVQRPTLRRVKGRRLLTLRLVNNGNVAERLTSKGVAVTLRAGRRKLTMRGKRVTILPGTRRLLTVAVPKGWSGRGTVSVRITPQNGPAAGAGVPRAKRIVKRFRVALGAK